MMQPSAMSASYSSCSARGLQRQGYFEGAGHAHVADVLFLHAQGEQLFAARGRQGLGDAFVEAGLHDADVQLPAVEPVRGSFVCAKHVLLIPWGCIR